MSVGLPGLLGRNRFSSFFKFPTRQRVLSNFNVDEVDAATDASELVTSKSEGTEAEVYVIRTTFPCTDMVRGYCRHRPVVVVKDSHPESIAAG